MIKRRQVCSFLWKRHKKGISEAEEMLSSDCVSNRQGFQEEEVI